ncbi:Chromosome segregation in meiosis protein 3 [Curvularia clavata]|uniref:Chromosome segregation in meiosis protein n=1 Tax=Curvularia clavata TaxID=95742 RepID=A0A9Q8Z369_CURCL|nr:Chromosome segregation in meiosis protein 3 [Curvularia clavata]
MAPAGPQTHNDDFDDDLDDILRDVVEPEKVVPSTEPPTQPESWRKNRHQGTNGDLGVDEEIVITKKREPAPKLDDQRLLSDPGIPRLRKISKDRLRFKGKGHEYGDIARMLNMYQLWLDDLYPRAKFADALAIVEKVGHTKRMQIMRKDWIDEGKPRRAAEPDSEEEVDAAAQESVVQQSIEKMDGVENGSEQQRDMGNPAADATAHTADEEPNEDELDALLAQSEEPTATLKQTLPTRPVPTQDDPFADEMEAMADMDDMWD